MEQIFSTVLRYYTQLRMRNTFGNIFTLTTFGESHGPGVGGVVDGLPAGIKIDTDFIQKELDRRKPGQSRITTSRNEGDKVELLSGVFEGMSTGCPIGFIVRNNNQHSSDYDNVKNVFRPSHADFTYTEKYVQAILRTDQKTRKNVQKHKRCEKKGQCYESHRHTCSHL